MKVTVDLNKCIGAGMCMLTAPSVFAQSLDTGLVEVLDPQPPLAVHDEVREAVNLCPARVLALVEAEARAPSAEHQPI